MQTQHGPDDKRKPCGKKRKQKTPKTGPDRAPRHDKGVAKKSMVSELTGMKGLGKMDDIRREGRYLIDRTITFYLFIFLFSVSVLTSSFRSIIVLQYNVFFHDSLNDLMSRSLFCILSSCMVFLPCEFFHDPSNCELE